jgi:uncharacterized protein with HEPN domain
MKRDHSLYFKDIVESCGYILEFVKGMDFDEFNKDEKTRSAVVRKFEIIGEAVKNIPEATRRKYPEIPWKAMAGMRDRLAHDYLGIDWHLVWDSVRKDIPALNKELRHILDQKGDK